MNISISYKKFDREILKYLETNLPANITKSQFIMECVRHKVEQLKKQQKININSFLVGEKSD